MKNSEVHVLVRDTDRLVRKSVAARIAKVLFEAFGHQSDVSIPPVPGLAPVCGGGVSMPECPFGVLVKGIRYHSDEVTVTWAWTLDGRQAGEEIVSGPELMPSYSLEAVLSAASLAASKVVLEKLRESLQGRSVSNETAIPVLKEGGCGVISDRYTEDGNRYTSSDIECAATEDGNIDLRSLPPYLVIAREGVQAIACVRDGKIDIQPWLWSHDTGIVAA